MPIDRDDRAVSQFLAVAQMRSILSSRGLERAGSINEKDFAFIGKSRQVECTRFQAAFISPRVHALLEADKTLDSLYVECETRGDDETQFFEFLQQLLNGMPIDPGVSEADEFFEVAAFLGNTELLDLFLHDEDPIDKSIVCSGLRKRSVLERPVDKEIEFAASNFYELAIEDLCKVDVSLLERIVSSPTLRLVHEDSLLALICSVKYESQIALLRYLRIEYLSCEAMEVFLDRFRDSIVDPLICDSVCRRLLLLVSPENSGRGTQVVLFLVFERKTFPVPKRSLFDLFEHRPELFMATAYAVQSSVPLSIYIHIFEMFVPLLTNQTKISVTKGNAASLSLLATEFFLADLAADCAESRVFPTGSVNWSSRSPPSQLSRVGMRKKLSLRNGAGESPPGTGKTASSDTEHPAA
jgi:hypothetical protein